MCNIEIAMVKTLSNTHTHTHTHTHMYIHTYTHTHTHTHTHAHAHTETANSCCSKKIWFSFAYNACVVHVLSNAKLPL